jgi:hypothetical protein
MTKQQGNSHQDVDGVLDKTLDGALASYTPATPRIGLEMRLQARLEAEVELPRRSLFQLPWVLAGAAVIASVAGLQILVHRSPAPVAAPGMAQAPHVPAPEQRTPRPEGLKDAAHSVAGVETPAYRARLAAEAKRPVHGDQPVSAIDRRALEEMRAASHPAPEEPLTQQERLLLRIAHKGDPVEMAMLNPVVRERQAAEGAAEFHKWVERSVKGQGE